MITDFHKPTHLPKNRVSYVDSPLLMCNYEHDKIQVWAQNLSKYEISHIGSKVLPQAVEAFTKLTDGNGKFRVPTVFVTNAGNCLRQTKADQLSSWLNVKITEDQVVMSHSPLKMFKEYHEKHVLVVGQGPVTDIAKNLGFTKISTMDDYRHAFPALDAVDHNRRQGIF